MPQDESGNDVPSLEIPIGQYIGNGEVHLSANWNKDPTGGHPKVYLRDLKNFASRENRATGGRTYDKILYNVGMELDSALFDHGSLANNGFLRKSSRDLETVLASGGAAARRLAQEVFLMADDARRGVGYRVGLADDFTAHSALGQMKANGVGYGTMVKGVVVGTVMMPVHFAQSVGGRFDGTSSLDDLGDNGFNMIFLLATLRGSKIDPNMSVSGLKTGLNKALLTGALALRSPSGGFSFSFADSAYVVTGLRSGPIQLLEVVRSSEAVARSVKRDGLTGDHIPSAASLRLRAEQALGRALTEAEARAVTNQGWTLVIRGRMHADLSRTFLWKNNSTIIAGDAANPWSAVGADLSRYYQALRADGHSAEDIVRAFVELQMRSAEAGLGP